VDREEAFVIMKYTHNGARGSFFEREPEMEIRTVYMFVFFFSMPQLLVLIARLSAFGERDQRRDCN
jgi:hypothetical protein